MAFTKRISLDLAQNLGTGLTVYAIIRRSSDLALLNDADGTFSALPVDRHVQLTEDAVIKGFYESNEKRTIWPDGIYHLFFYKQAGEDPVPASDTLVGIKEISIFLDAFATNSVILKKLINVETAIRNLTRTGDVNKLSLDDSIKGVINAINSISDSTGRIELDNVMPKRTGDI